MGRKYLQHNVIYFFTDTGQAAYTPDGVGFIYFDDLDEAQTETGITSIIQTTLEEFAVISAISAEDWDDDEISGLSTSLWSYSRDARFSQED